MQVDRINFKRPTAKKKINERFKVLATAKAVYDLTCATLGSVNTDQTTCQVLAEP